jgi:hypothetical protein
MGAERWIESAGLGRMNPRLKKLLKFGALTGGIIFLACYWRPIVFITAILLYESWHKLFGYGPSP